MSLSSPSQNKPKTTEDMKKEIKDYSVLLMAIAKGKESTDGASFKRYIGVGSCFVKAVNPTKEELEKAFDTTLEDAPSYVGEQEVDEDGAKVKYPNVRITFLVHPDPEKVGFDAGLISVSLFLRKQFRFNKDKTKVQVIDKYGRTAWATPDEVKNHEVPMYSNGPANLDKDFRPAYVGEEDLTNFIIAYLNIPGVMRYNKSEKRWYMVDNPQDSECRLDHIEDYFKGDFRELKEILSYQPNNKLKILFGVRNGDDGKQFQATYNQMFLKNSNSDYTKLEQDVQSRKDAGSYANTEFIIGDFREYTVEETNFSAPASDGSGLPFTAPGNNSPWGQMNNK